MITYISPSTILRFIRNKKNNIFSNYKIIGRDDWAFKKGHTYGTLICGLETNKPIDILKGRTSEVVEKWLEEHKTIEIVTRDSSSAYLSDINNVLPNSIQIADRFHLIKNLIQSFYLIFKEKDLKKFYLWINNAKTSSISKVHNFTNGLIKDMDAVSNAIKYSLSNAVLEGNISRLKMIKRQMYGRANFHLIKQKSLYNINV